MGGIHLKQRNPLLTLAGGISTLVVAMGIGRFAYTPILPLMVRQVNLSEAMAGYLGASNYLGYFLGAGLAGLSQLQGHRLSLLRLGLMLSLVTTGTMGWVTALPLWLGLRFLGGLASGVIFVIASSLVLDEMARFGRRSWAGLFYGGVGLGIIIAGLAVPWLDQISDWRWAWTGLALFSAPLAALAGWTLKLGEGAVAPPPAAEPNRATGLLPWLVAAYGLEGLGYIVTGTFLVASVEAMIGLPSVAAASWVLVGLAALPSSFLWTLVAARWGAVRTLILLYLLQAVGIGLPALWPTPPLSLLGAFLFGATFMGITSLTLSLARQIRPAQSAQVIGYLTAVYGLGQIMGPIGAGLLTSLTGGYRLPLLLAAGAVAAGGVLLRIGESQRER